MLLTRTFFPFSLDIFVLLQPVVDAFDSRLLVAPAVSHVINFSSVKVSINILFSRM